MDRLPALGSLRSIANAYEEDDISDEEDLESSAKKRRLSTEEGEKSEEKEENSEVEIVVSDEEGNSSGAGSANNPVVVNRPRSAAASRLVSYGGDEDEEDDANKTMEVEITLAENEAGPSAEILTQDEAPQPDMKEELAKTTEKQSTPSQAQETQNVDEQSTLPKELLDHLAAVRSIQVTLPDEPDGRCSNTLQEKIENLLETKKRTGRDLKYTIQRKKNFRNPSIYEKLVSFCAINETGTNYPQIIYDPFSWTEDSFYERLSKIQKEHHEKKQKERSKVEFVSATKKSGASTSDEAARKRKSKWDVTSTGTAALTIPQSAVQTIASVKAVVAAASSKKI